MKVTFLILLSFLSSFGDSVFLSGLPIYFYQDSGGSLLAATYVSLIITLTVLLFRKLIADYSQKDPVLITGYGELMMAAIECLVLILFLFTGSKWIILAGVFPLALIYNAYAPSKFFRLQDATFPKNNLRLTAWQSAAYRLGFLAGLAASGWISARFGAIGILVIDALSFAIFGFLLLVLFRKRDQNREESSPLSEDKSNVIFWPNLSFLPLALITLAFLFSSWEQGSAIATVSKSIGTPLDQTSFLRSIWGGTGILFGLGIIHIVPKLTYLAWFLALLGTTLGVAGTAIINPQLASNLLFLLGGALSCLTIPAQREIYRLSTQFRLKSEALPYQWVYNSALTLSVPLIAIASDKLTLGQSNHLQIALIGVLAFGLLGGLFISNLLRIPGQNLKPSVAIFIFGLMCASSLTSCKNREPYRTALLGNRLTNMDPIKLSEYNEITFNSQICGRLTAVDEALNIEGDIAESWEISPDQRSFIFTLKSDRHFYDGRLVTSEDVLFSIQRVITTEKSVASTWAMEIQNIQVTGPSQIRIELNQSNPRLLYTLSHPRFCILNKEQPFRNIQGLNVPNSCGPYEINRVLPDALGLHVSDDFKDRAIEHSIVVYFLDQKSAIQKFAKKELDDLSFYLLSDDEIESLRHKARILHTPMYWTWMLSLNIQSPHFKEAGKRQDLLARFNRDRFIKRWKTDMLASTSIIPPGMAGSVKIDIHPISTSKLTYCNRPIKVTGIEGMPQQDSLQLAIEEEITAATGCKTHVQFLEMGEFVANRQEGISDIYVHGIDTNSTDPLAYYREFVNGESDNFYGYHDSHFDPLFKRLYKVLPQKRTVSDYEAVHKAFYRAAFAIGLGRPNFKFLYGRDVQSIHMNPLGMPFNRWWKIGRK